MPPSYEYLSMIHTQRINSPFYTYTNEINYYFSNYWSFIGNKSSINFKYGMEKCVGALNNLPLHKLNKKSVDNEGDSSVLYKSWDF